MQKFMVKLRNGNVSNVNTFLFGKIACYLIDVRQVKDKILKNVIYVEKVISHLML